MTRNTEQERDMNKANLNKKISKKATCEICGTKFIRELDERICDECAADEFRAEDDMDNPGDFSDPAKAPRLCDYCGAEYPADDREHPFCDHCCENHLEDALNDLADWNG